MVLFARSQPDTPTKLAMHASSPTSTWRSRPTRPQGPFRPKVTLPRASSARKIEKRAPPARRNPPAFRPCRTPRPPPPNCINFSIYWVEKLMQFGWKVGRSEGSGGYGRNPRARGAATRGCGSLAALGPRRGDGPPLASSGGWGFGVASQGRLCRWTSASESRRPANGSGARVWTRGGPLPLQRRSSLGYLRLPWTGRGAPAVGWIETEESQGGAVASDPTARALRSHRGTRNTGCGDRAGAARSCWSHGREATGASVRPGL